MEKIWEIVLLLALIAFLSKVFLIEEPSLARPKQTEPVDIVWEVIPYSFVLYDDLLDINECVDGLCVRGFS